jgi:hydroxymethylbilane synthase
MKLRIAARSSDLARIQAIAVGEALLAAELRAGGELEVEYAFRESLGDKNQSDPLWKMPEKGVFTEDFRADLLSGACDLVVHSWKDLPIENREGTEIVATLPRADPRDLLLFKRKTAAALVSRSAPASVRILSSSPRRAYNLGPFLSEFLPHTPGASSRPAVEFVPVRGNVPTRVRKWLEGSEDGLVVAKAALDRLLGATDAEWSSTRDSLRAALKDALWMALPIAKNPPAAAQGALAIEIRSDRADLRRALARVNCEATFRAASEEREVLKGYGGGCHQKIGVAIVPRAFGTVKSLRGLTDAGVVLEEFALRESDAAREDPCHPRFRADRTRIWPENESDRLHAFDRVALSAENPGTDLWVSRSEALPEEWRLGEGQVVWTSGLETWRKLAARGIWVHGSAEGLGEVEAPRIETLVEAQSSRAPRFTKLSHDDGFRGGYPLLATYALRPRDLDVERLRAEWKGKTHFYWMSGSLFEYCLKKVPELRDANHSCGPGNTYTILSALLGSEKPIGVYLGYEDWKREITR